VEFDDPGLRLNQKSEPNGFADYFICAVAQNLISYLCVDCGYECEPDERFANNRPRRLIKLLCKEFVECGRKIAWGNVWVIGMSGEPKHGRPTMSQGC